MLAVMSTGINLPKELEALTIKRKHSIKYHKRSRHKPVAWLSTADI